MGLDDYLIQEGLVYRLTNQKNNTPMDIKMDIEKTITMITKAQGEPGTDNQNFIDLNQNGKWDSELTIKTKEDYIQYQQWLKEYKNLGTYRYNKLNTKGIFYGPNIERLAANYRNVFFKTATNLALNVERENHFQEGFSIIDLANNYFPSEVIPTEISYDYGALSYSQALLQVLQYKIDKNNNQENVKLKNDIELVEKNITLLLSKVNSELVKKYFPDFYTQ